MPSLKDQILARLDRTGVPDSRFPDAKGEYWALCPYHDDHKATNFSYNGEVFHCLACGKSGNSVQLAQKLGIEPAKRTPNSHNSVGCTLEEYAAAKHLDVGFLENLGLRTVKNCGKNELHIPYHDENGKAIRMKRRIRMSKEGKGPRFLWKGQGKEQPIYGLYRLEQIRKAGWALLVEGESDSHTAWSYGIPALGVPGASSWKKEWNQYLEGVDVYVWMEPDRGGIALAKALSEQIADLRVVRPGPECKDISEAHMMGMDVVNLLEEMKANAVDPQEALGESSKSKSLADIKQEITAIFHDREIDGRDRIPTAISIIATWLLSLRRLLVDTSEDDSSGGRPYIVLEDGAVWPLDKDCTGVRQFLYQLGFNPASRDFAMVFQALVMEAGLHGNRTKLACWQARRNTTLYISAGPCQMVRVTNGRLDQLANGTDGVWFASNRCYPAWSPAEIVDPRSSAAFQCSIETPDEVQTYTEAYQRDLIDIWFCALLTGIRPLPILLVRGDKGGGKSTVVRAGLRMLMGPSADLTQLSDDVRDFQTMAQHMPVIGLDNIDSDPPSWLADTLASIVTGMKINSRELYTNNRMITRRLDSAIAITTRTAPFARQDIAERSIPITTGSFNDGDRRSDHDMMKEVDENRDGLMSWAATVAQGMIAFMDQAPEGLPLRFVDLGKLIWAYEWICKRPESGAAVAQSLRYAQALVAGECDPLVQALAAGLPRIAHDGKWTGLPKALTDDLREAGVQLGYMGGGKAIARALRESSNTLRLVGIDVTWNRYGNGTRFTLTQTGPGPQPLAVSSGEPDAHGEPADAVDDKYDELFGLDDGEYDLDI